MTSKEAPSHCEKCGERPVNMQTYPLELVGEVWICSRHPEYPRRIEATERRTPGPKTIWDE